VKAVTPAKGRGSARHSNAGPIEVSLSSSLFAKLVACEAANARRHLRNMEESAAAQKTAEHQALLDLQRPRRFPSDAGGECEQWIRSARAAAAKHPLKEAALPALEHVIEQNWVRANEAANALRRANLRAKEAAAANADAAVTAAKTRRQAAEVSFDAAWPPFYIEQCVREAKVRAAKAAATAETAEAKKQRRAESRRRAASEAYAARFQARRRRGIRRLREKLRKKGALSATKEAELAALERELTEVSRADVGVEDGRAVFSGSGTPLGGAFNGRDAALEDVDPAAGGGVGGCGASGTGEALPTAESPASPANGLVTRRPHAGGGENEHAKKSGLPVDAVPAAKTSAPARRFGLGANK
jgi:hypothetical protein